MAAGGFSPQHTIPCIVQITEKYAQKWNCTHNSFLCLTKETGTGINLTSSSSAQPCMQCLNCQSLNAYMFAEPPYPFQIDRDREFKPEGEVWGFKLRSPPNPELKVRLARMDITIKQRMSTETGAGIHRATTICQIPLFHHKYTFVHLWPGKTQIFLCWPVKWWARKTTSTGFLKPDGWSPCAGVDAKENTSVLFDWRCTNVTVHATTFQYFVLTREFHEHQYWTRHVTTKFSSYFQDAQVSWTEAETLCQHVPATLPYFVSREDYNEFRWLVNVFLSDSTDMRFFQAAFIGLHRDNSVSKFS